MASLEPRMSDPTGSHPGPPVSLLTLTVPELRLYFAGRHDGYMDGEAVGYQRGWQARDETQLAEERPPAPDPRYFCDCVRHMGYHGDCHPDGEACPCHPLPQP